MSNTYFQFKEFIIQQDQCAMKVCTDACILGAWFAEKIPAYSLALDIGSGTGLLMLMLAQRHKGEIRGIELDLAAFRQLKENIGQSKWKDRLKAYPGDVRSYAFADKFDFIITNPPFYEGDLTAATDAANLARHSQALTLADLITVIDEKLEDGGSFGILLPHHRLAAFGELAMGRGFYLQERLLIRQTSRHEAFRGVLHFSRHQERSVPESELVIKDAEGRYTPEFEELMRDYYLKL